MFSYRVNEIDGCGSYRGIQHSPVRCRNSCNPFYNTALSWNHFCKVRKWGSWDSYGDIDGDLDWFNLRCFFKTKLTITQNRYFQKGKKRLTFKSLTKLSKSINCATPWPIPGKIFFNNSSTILKNQNFSPISLWLIFHFGCSSKILFSKRNCWMWWTLSRETALTNLSSHMRQ